MPNLPNNQIILDQAERSNYPLEDLETWETGAHMWHGLQKDNPSYFKAIPHKDGKFSTSEYQANGHHHQIINSSKVTQQDSRTDGTTKNLQTQVGGGSRNVNGQGEHRERGGDDTKAVDGSNISIDKSGKTAISQQSGHHGVKGDYGFYVKGGGYSIGAEKQVAITSQKTIHMEAEGEMSLKGIKNTGITSKGKLTLDSKDSMVANTGSSMLLNTATSLTANAGSTMLTKSGSDMTIESGSQIQLKVGGSTITITGSQIELKSGQVIVNNQQVTPTSNIFT